MQHLSGEVNTFSVAFRRFCFLFNFSPLRRSKSPLSNANTQTQIRTPPTYTGPSYHSNASLRWWTRRPRLCGSGLQARVTHHPTVCRSSAGKIKNNKKEIHYFKSNEKFWKLVHIDLFLIIWAHLYSGQKIKKTEREKKNWKDWVMYLLSVWKAVGSARSDAAKCRFCPRKLEGHRHNQRHTCCAVRPTSLCSFESSLLRNETRRHCARLAGCYL